MFEKPKRRSGIVHRIKRCCGYLKTSWGVQTGELFQHSSLHGVKYISAASNDSFIGRLMWSVCLTTGVVGTVVVIFSLWDKFQTNPTITGLDTDFHNWKVPFPAIMLCPDEPVSIESIKDYLGIDNATSYEDDPRVQIVHYFSRFSMRTIRELTKEYVEKMSIVFNEYFDMRELLFRLFDSCNNVFVACHFKGQPFVCCKRFHPILTESGLCYAFNSRHSAVGDVQFNMQYIKETDINWSLEVSVRSRRDLTRIYIVDSDDMITTNVQPQLVWNYKVDKILFSVKQTYTTEDTRQLSIKQRRCVFADEIKLNVDEIYTYTACSIQCRMDQFRDSCDCVPSFYPPIPGYEYCSMKLLRCGTISLKNFIECDCQLGCKNTVYEVEALSTKQIESDVNRLEIGFVSWPMVRYKREVLFGWVDLLVSFGGIAGLFLGFSIISIVEIVYYFAIRAVIAAFRERRYLDRIRRKKVEKPNPAHDLSLVPYFVSKPWPGHAMDLMVRPWDSKNDRLYKKRIIHVEMAPPFGIEFTN